MLGNTMPLKPTSTETAESVEQRGTKRLDLDDFIQTSSRKDSLLDKGMPKPWRICMKVIKSGIDVFFDMSGPLILGRSARSDDNDYKIVDLGAFDAYHYGVSRHHAMLLLEGEQVCIMDCGSSNGTFLNGELMESGKTFPLRDGDRVRLGKFELEFNLLLDPYNP